MTEENKNVEEEKEETPKEESKKLTKEEIDKLKYKQQEEREEVINKVIRGVNDIYEKEFKFDNLDEPVTFKIRYPNALEQGQILSVRSSYFNGTDMYQSQEIIYAFHMLATLNVVGIDVPKEFRNAEEIYRLEPLLELYYDWVAWLNTFRY